jgi:hypothetical protein
MVSGFDVVSKIRDYVEGELSLDSFRDWVVRSQIEIEEAEGKSPIDQDAERLLADIEGRYAELSDGLVSDGLWKQRLRSLIVMHPETVQLGLVYFFLQSTYSGPDIEGWGATVTSNFVPNFQPVPDFADYEVRAP